jgi:hypothetical protein
VTARRLLCSFYRTTVQRSAAGSATLTAEVACSDAVIVFVDGVVAATYQDMSHDTCSRVMSVSVTMSAGSHELTLLSENLGVDNGMSPYSTRKLKGIIGAVTLDGHDITNNKYGGLCNWVVLCATHGRASGTRVRLFAAGTTARSWLASTWACTRRPGRPTSRGRPTRTRRRR